MSNKASVRDVGLSGIAVPLDRMRALRPELVAELVESIQTNGLLQPIVIRPREGIGYFLVAGRHRYEAVCSLKWPSIQATVVDGMDADQALLAEIDENLVRADLSPAETAAHHAERKVIYLRIHPETKQGGAPGGGRGKKHRSQESQNGTLPKTFINDAAAKTGKGRTTVARSVQRGEKIPHVADLAGTSLDQGDELDALAKMTKAQQTEVINKAKAGEKVSAKTELKQYARADKELNLGLSTHAASKLSGDTLYNVIYADPPWKFKPWSGEGMDRAADNHYPTMDLDGIRGMKNAGLIPAAKDCVLFLWATIPMMPEALSVMDAWGFTYKSLCVWAKDRVGTGYWFRNKCEILLVGTRGDIPAPAPGEQYDQIINAKVDKHSKKPEAFAEMIEEMFPNLPGIELFAREPRQGWAVWGNEVSAQKDVA